MKEVLLAVTVGMMLIIVTVGMMSAMMDFIHKEKCKKLCESEEMSFYLNSSLEECWCYKLVVKDRKIYRVEYKKSFNETVVE